MTFFKKIRNSMVLGILFIFVFFCYYFLKSGYTQEINAVDLITPQEISLYHADDDTLITSYNDWAREVLTGAVSPSAIADWFGTYQFSTKDNKAFMAVGVDRPAGSTGALFVKADIRGGDPTQWTIDNVPVSNRLESGDPIEYIEEDGLHEMDWLSNGDLLIAGTDPAYSDGWEGGNAYKYDVANDTLVKIRCLTGGQSGQCGVGNFVFPDVIHFFALSVLGDTVFLAGSNPEGGSSDPVVFKSSDGGDTWSEIAELGTDWYRIKDIMAFQDTYASQTRQHVVASLADKFIDINENAIFYSNDQGVNPLGADWSIFSPLTEKPPHTFVKGTLFKGLPIYTEAHGDLMYRLVRDDDGNYEAQETAFSGFTVGDNSSGTDYYKHHAYAASTNWLYVIADDNAVYKSNLQTPVTWTKIAQFEEDDHIITLAYWSEQNALLAASHGLDAKLFYLDLPDEPIFSSVKKQSVDTPTCTYTTPESIPELFEIKRDGSKVTLSFSPVKGATGYYISYGLDNRIGQFGTSFSWTDTSGVVQYPIYDLEKNKTYSFSVRAQNVCQPGEWSKTVQVKPN